MKTFDYVKSKQIGAETREVIMRGENYPSDAAESGLNRRFELNAK